MRDRVEIQATTSGVNVKELRCGDLMEGCPAKFEGETIDDIIKQAAKHAHEEHGIADITPRGAAGGPRRNPRQVASTGWYNAQVRRNDERNSSQWRSGVAARPGRMKWDSAESHFPIGVGGHRRHLLSEAASVHLRAPGAAGYYDAWRTFPSEEHGFESGLRPLVLMVWATSARWRRSQDRDGHWLSDVLLRTVDIATVADGDDAHHTLHIVELVDDAIRPAAG